MEEYDEFAEALIDQLLVEIKEEKENFELALKIDEDSSFNVIFESLEDLSKTIFSDIKQKIKEFTEKDNCLMECKNPKAVFLRSASLLTNYKKISIKSDKISV